MSQPLKASSDPHKLSHFRNRINLGLDPTKRATPHAALY